MSIAVILEKISRYAELSESEMDDLYDHIDSLYNELISKYLEALLVPHRNKELVDKIVGLARSLLEKENRNMEEELMLIALLDILATDLYNKTAGLAPSEEGEEY